MHVNCVGVHSVRVYFMQETFSKLARPGRKLLNSTPTPKYVSNIFIAIETTAQELFTEFKNIYFSQSYGRSRVSNISAGAHNLY